MTQWWVLRLHSVAKKHKRTLKVKFWVLKYKETQSTAGGDIIALFTNTHNTTHNTTKNWQRYWYSDITTDISQIALWCYFLSILVLVCSRRWLDNNMGVTVLMMMKILLLAFLQEELLGEKGSHFVLVLVLKESCDTSLTPRRGRWRSGLVPSAGGRQD